MIQVHKKEDGLWIEFASTTGKSALINVSALAEKHGPIVGEAIKEACEEAGAALAPTPVVLRYGTLSAYMEYRRFLKDGGLFRDITDQDIWDAAHEIIPAPAPVVVDICRGCRACMPTTCAWTYVPIEGKCTHREGMSENQTTQGGENG